MSWWENSLDKAVGFSNYASTALKNAQKKIDKVLEIPTVDDLNVTELQTPSEDIKIEKSIDINYHDSEIDNNFSEIDLTCSPIKSNSEINLYRCGDWKTDESLTASQFETYHDTNSKSFDNVKIDYKETMESSLIKSDIPRDNVAQEIIDKVESEDIINSSFVSRNSHISMSSDCTIKRCTTDEMESSAETGMIQSSNSDDKSLELDKVEEIEIKKELHENDSVTTTSSDIELISGNASNNEEKQPHINQILENNQHGLSVHQINEYLRHQRSASGSSMSICKIDSYGLDEDANNLENQHHYQQQMDDLAKKLEIRENKLIQLSRENIDLRETINNLTRQIEQMNEHESSETTDLTNLTKEFTTRLNDAERRCQLATKDRDQLKKQLHNFQQIESRKIENVIKEKEDQIATLLSEGEKLAQDQLKSNNTIKKLRSHNKEKDLEITTLNNKLTKYENEISHLKKVLDSKEENERKHIEGINQLTKVVEKLEKDNSQLKINSDTYQERNQSLESAYNKVLSETTQLKRQLSEVVASKSDLELERETLLNKQEQRTTSYQDLQNNLNDAQQQIIQLQNKIQSISREFSYKEDEYNARINYLQERLGESQQRQDEANEVATQVSKPILRQLETLQNACSAHSANWDIIEQSLNNRIHELQEKLHISEEASSTDKEHIINQESIINSLREEKIRLMSQYKQEYNAKQLLLDEKLQLENQLSELENKVNKITCDFKNQIKKLEIQLTESLHKIELEKQNTANVNTRLVSTQILLNQQDHRQTRDNNSSASSTITDVDPDDSVSLQSNKSKSCSNYQQNPNRLISSNLYQQPPDLINISIYDSVRQQGVAATIEKLEANLKQKDGQIAKLSNQLKDAYQLRDSLMDELTALSHSQEQSQRQLQEQECQITQIDEINRRYDALLQMYGEKMDECNELQLDLKELKDVYRSHIDMLSKSTGCNL